MTKHLRYSLLMLMLMVFGMAGWTQKFEKVTDASSLADGDIVIIVNESNKAAISTTQSNNNRPQTTMEIATDGTISPSESVQQITLEASGENWMLSVGDDAYLYAASNSSNHLKTSTKNTVGDNGVASISFDNNGNATIKFTGKNARNLLRYNKSSSIFSCYASGQEPIQLYKKQTTSKEDVTLTLKYQGEAVDAIELNVGAMQELTYECSFPDAVITFESSNSDVVYYEDGYLYTSNEGTATITAKFAGDDNYNPASATLVVTVVDPRQKVTLSFPDVPETININETATYTATSEPEVTGITYSSTNPDIVMVDETTGEIAALAVGTVSITASFAGDNNYKPTTCTYTITVIDPNKKGTLNNPYTVAEAIEVINAGGETEVYVKGIVSQVDEVNTQYGNATYWISDNGTTNTQMEVFRGKYLNNTNFTSVDQIQLKDVVIVYGNLTEYNNTPEFAQGNYIVSLERKELEDVTITLKNDQGEPVESLELNVGAMSELTYECSFPDAVITFESSNTDIVQYEEGYLFAYNEGKATITATFAGDEDHNPATATLEVTVVDPRLEVTLSFPNVPETINLDETATYAATSNPEVTGITYSSSDENIVMVDETTGEIAALALGTASITASFAGNDNYKPTTGSYTIKVVDPNAVEKTATLTNENITDGSRQTGYTDVTLTDDNGNDWKAHAIKNYHSNATSDHHFLQIKKNDNSGPYYIQVPEFGNRITKIEMTVSSSSKPMDGGDGFSTLFFSNSNQTSAAGDGVASGTTNEDGSKATIDCSALNLNTGYITAAGAIRIWDVTVTYETTKSPEIALTDQPAPAPNATIIQENAGETVTVTVTRNVKAGQWNTIYLPFAMTADQIAAAFGADAQVAGLTSYDAENEDLMFSTVTETQANTAYLIQPDHDVTEFMVEDVELVYAADVNLNDPLTAFIDNAQFMGVVDNQTVENPASLYYLANGNKIKQLTAGGTLKAFRGYFLMGGGINDDPFGAKTFTVDGAATGIIAVENGEQLFRSGEMYNTAGQRVGNSYRGVVIVNGKKVIKK